MASPDLKYYVKKKAGINYFWYGCVKIFSRGDLRSQTDPLVRVCEIT